MTNNSMRPQAPLDASGLPSPVPQESGAFSANVPHSARVYDYWLGGKDNFAVDRAVGDAIAAHVPGVRMMVRANRQWMLRVTHHLVRKAGIRQFLDIGTGIPTTPYLHQAAQEIEPRCRVVYVDNDPIVLSHARALLTSTRKGAASTVPLTCATSATSWPAP